MKKNNPLVTVLLPVYNAEKYIGTAIESILDQTYEDFELLIINDGSTDRSQEIIKSYTDDRIQLVNNERNLKLIATLNKGLELARGIYIARMDADDISLPDRLELQVDFMQKNQNVGLCGSWYESFGDNNSVVRYPTSNDKIRIMMLYQTPFCHPSLMFRKELFSKNNIRFDPEFIHAEDLDVWVRLSGITQFANLPKILLRYRIHSSSISIAFTLTQQENTLRILKKQFHQMGSDLDDKEIQLYLDIAHATFRSSKDYIESVESLLVKLSGANRTSGYISEDIYNKYLAEKWFHICRNASSLGSWIYQKYKSSYLYQLQPGSPLNNLKFFIKSRR